MQRTKQDISALIEKGETFHLECKKAQGGLPSSLWESYSAFCNTDGGVILLGVKEFEDKHFEVVGVSDAQKLVQDFTNTLNDRNKGLQKMFQFLGYSEKAGSGFPKIFMGTDEQHWARPFLQEDFKFEQTTLTMPTVDLSEDSPTANIGAESDQNPTKTRPITTPEVSSTLKSTQKTAGITLKSTQKTTDSTLKEIVEKDPSVTIESLATLLGITRDGVNKAIRRLKTAGAIRRVGPDKGGHWEIVNAQPPTGGPGS